MNNLEAYYKGALLGLVFIMSFGPVFFALIETSLDRGFRFAACIALGTVISDAAFIAVSKFGLSKVMGDPIFDYWLGLGGGVLLIFLSGFYFFKRPTIIEFPDDVSGSHFESLAKVDVKMAKPLPVQFHKMTYLAYMVKGFLINTLNPFLVVFWLGAVGIVEADHSFTDAHEIIFFAGSLSSIFFFDLLKGFLASRVQHLLNYQRMLWMNRIAGGVMLYFGIMMLVKTLVK